jgi:hypothetical protein
MMISVRAFTLAIALLVLSCEKRIEEHTNAHEVVIEEFQITQMEFKNLVSEIRDTTSYDLAAPRLKNITNEFDRIASALKALDPPDFELAESIRRKIEEGNRAAEPTGEDMISLISIEGREDEAQAWIAEFALSGQRLGTELTRLYPPNKMKENKPAHPTAGNAPD